MARLHDSRHGSDADGIDDDDMPLTHEQAVVEADAELRRMTYHPVRKAVGIVVAMGVAIGASLGVGYMFGGDPGGIVTAITGVVCPQDAKYALDGDAPFVNTSDTSEHPAKGARLSEKDAGQYYLEAVKPSIQPLRDMRESTSKPSTPGMTMSSSTMEMPLPCCSRHAMPASPQSASRISY